MLNNWYGSYISQFLFLTKIMTRIEWLSAYYSIVGEKKPFFFWGGGGGGGEGGGDNCTLFQ